MKATSTPSVWAFMMRGAAAGLLCIGLLVALMCTTSCGTERQVVAQKGHHNGYGLQKQRTSTEKRKLNDYYNNKQHEKYQNVSYY